MLRGGDKSKEKERKKRSHLASEKRFWGGGIIVWKRRLNNYSYN